MMRIKRSQKAYWEGKARRILSVPNTAIRKLILKNSFFELIFLTDIVYYPRAASHYVNRDKGSPENIIIYCANGKGWFETEDGYFEVHPNQFFILPNNQKHRYGADLEDPWSIYLMMFSGKISTDIHAIGPIEHCFKPNILLDPQKFIDLFENMYDTLSEGCTINNLTLVNMNLWSMLMLFIEQKIDRHKKLKDTPLEKVVNFMKENIGKNLSINELAALISFSPSHFYTLFKSQTGYSPVNYFIHLKIQCACQYLNNTDLRIKEIAVLVGYDDQYLFSRIFTKMMGQSPRNYRSTQRI